MKAMWAGHVASELARRWYDKPDPALLRLCDERRETARRQHIRATSWLGILIYVSFGYVDFVLAPDVAPQLFTTRIVLGAIGLILLESMLRFRASSAMLEIAAAATVVEFYAACLGLACTSSQPDAVSYYMMFGIIYMLAATVFFNFPPMLSVAAGVALLVVSFGITLVMLSVWSSFYYAFGSLYGSCFAFSVHVNWRLNVERYNGFLNALQAEIRQDEVVEQGKELLRLSNTDALTGLENRRSIDARLIRLWEDHGRSGADFAVLLLDIDCFKQFNDGYGHQEGDRCLALVAGVIAGAAATFGGSAGRYGGEEFIILTPAATPDQASALAECVRSAVEAIALPHRHRRDGLTVVTVSIGASITRPDGAATPEAIVREADRALYEAKAGGRNCVRSFDPGAAGDGETIAALLTVAIAQDLVSLVYQPIRGLASGRVEGVETLMRLRMPDGTPVPPGDFIPVAERTGAIVDLGLWAIRTVCRDLLADGAVPFASVNVSSVQLKRPGFAASVAAILAETGVSGGRLALEFSDGPDLGAHATILLGITNLKRLGVRIWLDDFGTGFAGLSWLHLIDFDVVKIDRPFLHHCGDAEGLATMRDIVRFLRDRGHTILVEGVETPDQLALMHDLGIDQVQGFHVGVPVPATAYRSKPAAAGPMVADGTERRPVERAG